MSWPVSSNQSFSTIQKKLIGPEESTSIVSYKHRFKHTRELVIDFDNNHADDSTFAERLGFPDES